MTAQDSLGKLQADLETLQYLHGSETIGDRQFAVLLKGLTAPLVAELVETNGRKRVAIHFTPDALQELGERMVVAGQPWEHMDMCLDELADAHFIEFAWKTRRFCDERKQRSREEKDSRSPSA